MTDTDDRRRRNRIPPLAIIIVALLALLAVIAWIRSDGSVRSPDAEVSMPVDLPDAGDMPDPELPPAPTPRPS